MSVIDQPAAHLLPPNATPLERVFAASGGRRIGGVPVPIDLLKRPFEVPAAFLPHLAWEVSLDVWDEDWPEWRKRRAVARSIYLHRLKGTLPGFEGWLDLIGAKLQSYVIPPIGGFVSPDRTEEEKRAFVQQFAELRIYTQSDYGTADADLYVGDGFVDVDFATVSTAKDRYGRRAYVVDHGQTRQVPTLPVTWAGADAILEDLIGVVIPGEDDGGFFLADAFIGEGYVTEAKITSKLLSIAANRSFLPISPRPVLLGESEPFTLINVMPERVATKGTIGPDVMHTDDGYIGDFLGDKDAHLRIYDRFYLYDPDRVIGGPGSDGGLFVDHTRLEIPPFYAELRVAFPGSAPVPSFMLEDAFIDEGTLLPVEGLMDRVAAVLRAAKSHRDDIWFTTQTSRPIGFDDAPPFDGSIQFDSLIPLYD